MARNKNAKKVAKVVFKAPVIGDIGQPRPPHIARPMTDDEQLAVWDDSMSTREMIQLALAVGIDAKDVLGVDTCGEHRGYVVVKEAFQHSKHAPEYVQGLDLVWCNQCWDWFRSKKAIGGEA